MDRSRGVGLRKEFDLSLYLVTDPDLSLGRPEEEVVRRAVGAGVTMVQYRDKNTSTRRMLEKTRLLSALCRRAGIPLIVNDRLDVAMAGGADGVHLGQDDMEPEHARELAGDSFIIGVSVREVHEVRRAEEAGADYLAANGVYQTGTKTDFGPPLGLKGLRGLLSASTLPMVAIGGINDENAGQIISAGAAGVAVVSFIVGADRIEARCETLLQEIWSARGKI